jgi:hypothetical protein
VSAFEVEALLLRAYPNGTVVLEIHQEDANGFLHAAERAGRAGQRFAIRAHIIGEDELPAADVLAWHRERQARLAAPPPPRPPCLACGATEGVAFVDGESWHLACRRKRRT